MLTLVLRLALKFMLFLVLILLLTSMLMLNVNVCVNGKLYVNIDTEFPYNSKFTHTHIQFNTQFYLSFAFCSLKITNLLSIELHQ